MTRLPAGYAARAATHEDLDAIVEVFAAWETIHLDEPVMTRSTLEDDWSHAWFDPARDTVLVEAGDAVVGYASCECRDRAHPYDAWAAVRPDHEGRGLGVALARWVEERVQRDLAPGTSARLWNGTNGRNAAGIRLFEERGYSPARTFAHMSMDIPAELPPTRIPDDVAVRVCDGHADEHGLWMALQDAFSTHFGFFPQPQDAWWVEQRGYPSFDPALMLVATTGDEVVGGAIDYVDDDVGWIGEVGVRSGWRRRGIGRALLAHSLSVFAERGLSRMRLNVDLENASNASNLYRSFGMHVVEEWRIFEKSITRD